MDKSLTEERVRDKCPICGNALCYFSGLEQIPEFLYCPFCNDLAFDYNGNVLFNLE